MIKLPTRTVSRTTQFPRFASTLNYFQNKQKIPQPGVNPENPQYSHYYQPKKTKWSTIFTYTIATVGISSLLVYEFLWPKHSFPSSVAKILRKLLWAESEKEDHNYEKAMALYKDALKQCDVENISHLSDEYTGIQIKIGEMCEKLGLIDDAIDIYYEILQNYFKFLQSQVHSPPTDTTKHIVQKDLRLIVKIAELSKDHISFLTSLLTIHLDLALHEVVKRLILRGHSYDDLVGKEPHCTLVHLTSEGNVSDPEHLIDIEIWEPFRDEYFNARDLLSALCLSSKGPAFTTSFQAQTLRWMLLAQFPLSEYILCKCKVASLFYLTAESYEGQELRLQKELKNLSEENFSNTEMSFNEYQSNLQNELNKYHDLKQKFIKKSLNLYIESMDFIKKLPPKHRNAELEEAAVLSTYGAGVVNLHLGNYDTAETFLKEAILRAKGSGNEFELKELERELGKLNMERERLLSGGLSNKELKELNEIETIVDIQFDKNL